MTLFDPIPGSTASLLLSRGENRLPSAKNANANGTPVSKDHAGWSSAFDRAVQPVSSDAPPLRTLIPFAAVLGAASSMAGYRNDTSPAAMTLPAIDQKPQPAQLSRFGDGPGTSSLHPVAQGMQNARLPESRSGASASCTDVTSTLPSTDSTGVVLDKASQAAFYPPSTGQTPATSFSPVPAQPELVSSRTSQSLLEMFSPQQQTAVRLHAEWHGNELSLWAGVDHENDLKMMTAPDAVQQISSWAHSQNGSLARFVCNGKQVWPPPGTS